MADHPVIHRDIKASNILLTEKLRAKVADFGFARLASEDPDATHISTQVKGTAGYLDPEYLRTYQLTEKSDVYSFGVLLVEIVSGRRPMERSRNSKERITTQWVSKSLCCTCTSFEIDSSSYLILNIVGVCGSPCDVIFLEIQEAISQLLVSKFHKSTLLCTTPPLEYLDIFLIDVVVGELLII